MSRVLTCDPTILKLQDINVIKQLKAFRPDEYLCDMYRIDLLSHSDYFSDPTLYRKTTKEIKSYIAERTSVRKISLKPFMPSMAKQYL